MGLRSGVRCRGLRVQPVRPISSCESYESAHHPPNEVERLAALRQLLLLDTAPEERFDMIVGYAASEFDVPICLITLVDAERQWFKSRIGLPMDATTRDISFCSHAILESDMLVVEDALSDQRFADNPLVTSDPNIRFYAGVPLILPGGHAVGTLCIIDTAPRQLDQGERSLLTRMRDMVLAEIDAGPAASPAGD